MRWPCADLPSLSDDLRTRQLPTPGTGNGQETFLMPIVFRADGGQVTALPTEVYLALATRETCTVKDSRRDPPEGAPIATAVHLANHMLSALEARVPTAEEPTYPRQHSSFSLKEMPRR